MDFERQKERRAVNTDLFHITSYRLKKIRIKKSKAQSSQNLPTDIHKQASESRNNLKENFTDYQNSNQKIEVKAKRKVQHERQNRSKSVCKYKDVLLLFRTLRRSPIIAANGCVNYFAVPLIKQKWAKKSGNYMKVKRKNSENKKHPILISRNIKINYRKALLSENDRIIIKKELIRENKLKQENNTSKHINSFAELFDRNDSLLSPW